MSQLAPSPSALLIGTLCVLPQKINTCLAQKALAVAAQRKRQLPVALPALRARGSGGERQWLMIGDQ